MSADDWVAQGFDPDTPSAARIYDYWLGGAHNFRADRRVGDRVAAAYHNISIIAHVNRAFLRRAVTYLADAGVRQFLDIGAGIPTVGHVHEIARHTARDARVVYVDIDPVAVAHSRDILNGDRHTAAIQEDLRRPERILAHPEVTALFDLAEPVGVLLVAMLHHVPDRDDPAGVIARLMAPLASGSHLVISHATDDGPVDMRLFRDIYERSGIPLTWRDRAQVTALFGACRLVPPGLVWAPSWHPESTADALHDDPPASANYAGIGRKP